MRESILSAADLACSNYLTLHGTGGKPRFIGNPINWCDRSVEDPEYVWALNRMAHWLLLGKAALLTGDVHYAQKVSDEWNDWIDRCPPPDYSADWCEAVHGVHGWRQLEVGIRSFATWPFAWDVLSAFELLTPELAERIAQSVRCQGQILAEYSPKVHPNADHNHYLMEMFGLFTIALRFPQLPEASLWKTESLKELERCMATQMTAEGGQIEGCPHYHSICVDFFCQAVLLGRENGVSFSEDFLEKLRRSIDYSIQVTRPTGNAVPWGDSDADGLPIQAGIYAFLVDGNIEPLRVLAQFTPEEEFLRHFESHIWRIPAIETLQQQLRVAPATFPPRLSWHRQLNQVTARSQWDRNALSLFVGCRTPAYNGHAHIDPGAFDLCALGKALVVDPGRFTYREGPDRYEFKRASSHNMLLVDERDPFQYSGSWAFSGERSGCIAEVEEAGDTVTIVCKHENYHPVIHRRVISMMGSEAVVIIDHVTGLTPAQSVQLYFHINSTIVHWDDSQALAYSTDPEANVAILAPAKLKGSLLPGRISDVYDSARPSTRLRLSDSGGDSDRFYVSVLVPFYGNRMPAIALSIEDTIPHFVALSINGKSRRLNLTHLSK